ncbi:hypothetical protein SLS55_004670 [Diplodia seriata]|uniref:Uncharacterized protein n=1 Tax=Diplodia seriata TaxID=420778 RepID=A0ABR3CK27_9PEZI
MEERGEETLARKPVVSSGLKKSISADELGDTSQEDKEESPNQCSKCGGYVDSPPPLHHPESAFDWSDDPGQSEDEDDHSEEAEDQPEEVEDQPEEVENPSEEEEDLSEEEEDLSEEEEDQPEGERQSGADIGERTELQAGSDRGKAETGSLRLEHKRTQYNKSPKEIEFHLHEKRAHLHNLKIYNCEHEFDHNSWNSFEKCKERMEYFEEVAEQHIYAARVDELLDTIKAWVSYQGEMFMTWFREKESWRETMKRWVDERKRLKDDIKLLAAKDTDLRFTFGEPIGISPTCPSLPGTAMWEEEPERVALDFTEQMPKEESSPKARPSPEGSTLDDSTSSSQAETDLDPRQPCHFCGAEDGCRTCKGRAADLEEVEDLKIENQRLKWRLEQQEQMEQFRKHLRSQPSSKKWERLIGDAAGKIEQLQMELLARRVRLLSVDGALGIKGDEVTVSLSNISTSILDESFTRPAELGERDRIRGEVWEQLSHIVGIEGGGELRDEWRMHDTEMTRRWYEDAGSFAEDIY